jgi:hypothetical protein
MEYKVTLNKKFKYVKIYNVKKKVNENTNAVSQFMQRFVDKYILKTSKID